jgi:outer membrane receptor protein involved in Fe transport
MVNSRNNSSISYSDSKSVGASLQLNRKFGNMGRNVTLRVSGNYNNSNNKSLSTNNVHLYQVKNSMGSDSTYQTNRYNLTPTKNYSYSIQTTYSEPIWKATFLQFSYQFNYSYSKSDRYTYDFSNLGEDFFSDLKPIYRNWDSYLSRLENPYTDYLDKSLSRYSEYKNYTHEMQVMFRMIRSKYNFNIGAMLQPQKSHFIQNYQGKNVDTTRTVTNFSPTLDFRYRFSKTSNLRINYRGTTQQPSISDMLDITDDSDPLNITKGNPGLKPSFTNTLRLIL